MTASRPWPNWPSRLGSAEATVRAILDYNRHVGSLDAPLRWH